MTELKRIHISEIATLYAVQDKPDGEYYDAKEADKVIAEKDKELRATKRALWLARANAANLMATKEAFVEYKREHPFSRWNDVRGGYSWFCSFTNWSRMFINVERKCRAYADKFKEET